MAEMFTLSSTTVLNNTRDDEDEELPVFDFQFNLEEYFRPPEKEEQVAVNKQKENDNECIGKIKPGKRFATLSDADLDRMVENGQAKKTKYVTNWAVSTFEGNLGLNYFLFAMTSCKICRTPVAHRLKNE